MSRRVITVRDYNIKTTQFFINCRESKRSRLSLRWLVQFATYFFILLCFFVFLKFFWLIFGGAIRDSSQFEWETRTMCRSLFADDLHDYCWSFECRWSVFDLHSSVLICFPLSSSKIFKFCGFLLLRQRFPVSSRSHSTVLSHNLGPPQLR